MKATDPGFRQGYEETDVKRFIEPLDLIQGPFPK